MANSRFDAQFVLDANKAQHKLAQDEQCAALKRAVRSKQKATMARIESSTPPSALRSELLALYKSAYAEDTAAQEQTSKMLHSQIKQMTQFAKPTTSKASKRRDSNSRSNSKMANSNCGKHRDSREPSRKRQKRECEQQFTPAWNASLVRRNISVFWPLDKRSYKGRVSRIDNSREKPILVQYVDGDEEWLNLRKEKFKILPLSDDESDAEVPEDAADSEQAQDGKGSQGSKFSNFDDGEMDLKTSAAQSLQFTTVPTAPRNQEQSETTPTVDVVGQNEEKGLATEVTNSTEVKEETFDPLIDEHVTIVVDGLRLDGIPFERKADEVSGVWYHVKFDASNAREDEWVRRSQIEQQEKTTCAEFEIGDEVEVRESGQWMEVVARVNAIYQGATGIIVRVCFPELDEDVFMYVRQSDVRSRADDEEEQEQENES